MSFQIQTIRQKGMVCYAIYDAEGERVSAVYNCQDKARTRLKGLLHSAELRRQKTDRACMCCGTTFRSSHKFNRLCDFCRKGTPRTIW